MTELKEIHMRDPENDSRTPAAVITGDRTVSHEEMEARIDKVAGALLAKGLGEGQIVAQLMRNDTPIIEVNVGARRVGCYSVPLNWHLAAPEIQFLLEDSGAEVLVAHADLLRPVRDLVPEGCEVIVVETPPSIREAFRLDPADCTVPAGERNYEDWIAAAEPHAGENPADRGVIIYTSGTTGKPKGVMRDPMTPEETRLNARVFRDTIGIAPDMRGLIATPLYHASPNGFARYAATQGELLVITPRFDAEEFLALIEKHRINVIVAVPTIFVKLLKLPKEVREKYDVSSLRFISHTASACPVEVKRELMEWVGPIVHEVYGGTEVGIALHASPEDWLKKPGTVGRCVEHAEVRILGENDEILGPNEPGEIYVKNGTYSDFTYIKNPEARAECEKDGFISIGDVGYLDEDGFLFISDRKRDMIIFAGTNIYPAEIESELVLCPEVADCAVFGLPDPEFGEVVAAYIQPAPGTTPDADSIRAFLEPRIAKYKIPRRIEIVPTLPREESGKLMKRKLRDAVIAGTA
ncbi:AMP-binding protein [Maritimibacter alkaliphilus]|nr:AMP-binding protein [Maritimibacter alkaliphilus]